MDALQSRLFFGSGLCRQSFSAQYATGSALTAGDMLVDVLSGSEVGAMQGH